jgi:hypothetical protein
VTPDQRIPAPPDLALDRQCRALLAYHVQSGDIDGVDVSGLNLALFLDAPQLQFRTASVGG